MALENIQSYPSGLITFTDRTPDDFTAQVALSVEDMTQLLNALPNDIQDIVTHQVTVRQAKEAVAELFANRR